MAYLVGKKQKGKTYYYLTESARVNGKPRIVSQQYLGSAEEIAQRLSESGPGEPDRSRHLAFGDLAGVWGVLDRIGVAEIIDEVVGSRRSDAASSVGTYLAMATLNRVVAPCSKLAFADWWETTAGDRVVGQLSPAALDHRRFWDAMDMIRPAQLVEIERRITERVVESYEVDVSGLALDMTNFATFIDSSNDRAPIAQRGKAKQKRNDLRLVGLGLVVSVDGGIPLVSHAYPGNRHDSSQFADVVGELVERFGSIGQGGEGLTVVFDAGQNSADNLKLLEGGPLHFIGSMPPSDHLDLMAVPKSRYQVVDPERFEGLSAFESTKVVFGHRRRIVVTFSQNFFDKQAAGFEQTLAKARRQLSDVASRLQRGAGRKSAEKVQAEIEGILAPRWLSRVISVTLRGTEPSELRLTWRTNARAKAALADELFGKRVIFTNRDEWSIGDVVAGYRSQSEAEADFRQMKDRRVVSFSPMFHWTDQKVRVHVFYCVLALLVARLMRRETERAGSPMSVRALFSSLAGIEETLLLYQGERGRPRARRMLTEMDATQERLYGLFGLDAYAPTR
jgi:transposase